MGKNVAFSTDKKTVERAQTNLQARIQDWNLLDTHFEKRG